MAIRRFALLAAVGAAIPMSANAAQIVQTKDWGPGYPNMQSVETFNKFNGPGTLNFIKIDLTLDASGGSVGLDGDSPSPSSGNVTFGTTAAITSVSVPLPFPGVGPLSVSSVTGVSLTADDGDTEVGGTTNYSSAGGDYASVLGPSGSDADSKYVAPANWSFYSGAGTYQITIDANQALNYGALSGIQALINPQSASGTLVVTYDYTIPEPASLGLAALSGLLLLKRKRHA
jgi:hypothetical protein